MHRRFAQVLCTQCVEEGNGYLDDLRDRLGDRAFRLDDDTLVVLQRFKIVERLEPT